MAEQNRTPRELNLRPAFERADSWRPPSMLPEINQQPGWAYRWIRTSMLGNADAMNVSSKMREGWEPVKLADHPEMQMFTDPNSRHKDCIEVGGLMLCKIPEEFVKQRAEYYQQQTQRQADAVDNNFMKENDARMPLYAQRKSSISFGKGK